MSALHTAEKIALLVANAWEKRSTNGLRDVLAADFEYASQWVFDTMRGADTYVDYLTSKFNGHPTQLLQYKRQKYALFRYPDRNRSGTIYDRYRQSRHATVDNQQR